MATLGKKRKKIAIITATVVMGTAVAAFAYWTAGGSGTGSANTGSNNPITAVQGVTPSAMAPGDSAQSLAGTFTNTNTGPVYVATVTASIASVFQNGVAATGCDATDYTLANPVMTVDAQIPVGSLQGTWSGATIKFNNKPATNQDACKGATVNLAYVIG